jgi:hypothetical protein
MGHDETPGAEASPGLADEIARLSLDSLVEAYRHDCVVAPRRPESGKRYLVETHDGRPRSGAFTNRNEEHLALALWNDCTQGAGLFLQPTGLRLHLVDYQVPLKAAQSDRVGKLDLLGLLDDGTLCLVELKAPGERGDSPLLALLEALSYAAVVEANRNALDAELREKFPEGRGTPPWSCCWGPKRGGVLGNVALRQVSGSLASRESATNSRAVSV